MKEQTVNEILSNYYGITATSIKSMSCGVGGDTFLVESGQDYYVIKFADQNQMNNPKMEPLICEYLSKNKIPVSEFIMTKEGNYVIERVGDRCCHLQKYVKGKTYGMNQADPWFMDESPIMLGKIHRVLKDYLTLPEGIGANFFRYMTPQNAKNSYLKSIEHARNMGDEQIIEDLEVRINAVEMIKDWTFDLSKLTICNTHGDYTVNQIICDKDSINAVIDWTSACRHPAIWEVTRSFFYAEPTCITGTFDEDKLKEYLIRYRSEFSLSQYDMDCLLKLYYYQLAVCDYYSQYYQETDASKKEEFLMQATFASKVIKNIL